MKHVTCDLALWKHTCSEKHDLQYFTLSEDLKLDFCCCFVFNGSSVMSSNTASSSELPVNLAVTLSRLGDAKKVGILQIRDSVLRKKAFFKYFIPWTKIARFTKQ